MAKTSNPLAELCSKRRKDDNATPAATPARSAPAAGCSVAEDTQESGPLDSSYEDAPLTFHKTGSASAAGGPGAQVAENMGTQDSDEELDIPLIFLQSRSAAGGAGKRRARVQAGASPA